MTFESAITQYRPLLFRIAFEMTGDRMDAEDILQENILKWLNIDFNKIKNIKAYLIKSITNSCINHLKSLKKRREALQGFFNDMPAFELDFKHLDIEKEISEAVNQLIKKLDSAERAIFLLREVFNFDYQEITQICNKKKENCRQIYHRAKDRLSQNKTRFQNDRKTNRSIREEILDTFNTGQLNQLIETLKTDMNSMLKQKRLEN